jgi:hypothetical protein
MKTACLLFLTISWAALTQGTGYAIPSGPASQPTFPESAASTASDHPYDAEHAAPTADGRHQSLGQASDERRDVRRASRNTHLRSRAGLATASRPKQLPNSRKRSLPGNAMNLRQPGLDESRGAAKGGLIPKETFSTGLPVRPSVIVRPTGSSFNSARRRGPNPAVIGGSTSSDSRNTGAINGTGMHRRP